MRNNGLFSTLFLDDLKRGVELDDMAQGRMATLAHAWKNRRADDSATLWDRFLKQALGYLNFVPANTPVPKGMYPLYEDYGFSECVSVLYLVEPGSDLDDTTVGRFWPARLVAELKKRKLNWGILTDGGTWRLYSLKSSRPYEDYVELPLATALEKADEAEYGLFERFFHIDSFTPADQEDEAGESGRREDEIKAGVYTCRLDEDREASEAVLEERVKKPLLSQVDEALQYICNGFILDTRKSGEDYSEEERREIFESAVKLLYRCLFLFYAEARRLLPSEAAKSQAYRDELSIHALCEQARRFKWGQRQDNDDFDLWQHLKGLVAAVNDGDPQYGIMGYNGGLFDDSEERFLGAHRLRNDFLCRALYLLAYVEPYNNDADEEYEIPYADLEVRHLGELYENILEFNVSLCDADRLRRRTKKGVQILLASENQRQERDTLIIKGQVYFGESALERKQTGSYYTPESLVRFLNEKAIIAPLRERFDADYRPRFEQFLESIDKGMQQADVKGAARSAAAQVRRFVDEVVLKFRVCDPAMGSGHFLVDAANQMGGLVVELLAEIPDIQGMNADVDSSPNTWRRLITRHCLYGVDLNRLAVNLAKLSLWLNCFATNHKLTFLDHHLRNGNSLIGLRTLDQLKRIPKRKRDGKTKQQPALFDLDDLSAALSTAAAQVSHITEIDEDDTDRQKSEFEEARSTADESLAPLADLFTAYLMDSAIERSTYERLFTHFTGRESLDPLSEDELRDAWVLIQGYRQRHEFFHWALEFPDVMGGVRTGFDATVGNPPWDVIQPNSQEFYSEYDPAFRSYKKQEAIKRIKTLHTDHPLLDEKWDEYVAGFTQASNYCKELAAYEALTKGKIDLYKAFLERFWQVLRYDGYFGIVCPSGLYTDQGCLPLRKLFFQKSQIQFLYCFENRNPPVFPAVHRMFKFILFCTKKGGKTENFKCAFMQHDPGRLAAIDAGALRMTVEQVKKFSPDTLSVMEFKNQRDVNITARIYGDWPFLWEERPESWNVSLRMGDYNLTNDSHCFEALEDIVKTTPLTTDIVLLSLKKVERFPVFEGKQCWFFDSRVALPALCVRSAHCQDIAFSRPRVGFRRIAASTNERTLVPCIVPSGGLCTYGIIFADDNVEIPLSHGERAIYAALLSSFVLDFAVRFQITTSISNNNGYSLPVPRVCIEDYIGTVIMARVARLLCIGSEFADFWECLFSPDWRRSAFWYPLECNMDYGPAHEQDIRARLAESATSLTAEWMPACGVHDRLPDRRDAGDRAQLRAEIDAYVAHLYGLSRDDFAYILDTFPVLKRKEMKAFGEFMSKRKCLEEYDRLAPIVEISQ